VLTAQLRDFTLTVLLLPVFFFAFAWAKTTLIPPFTWDARLASFDRWLHGTDPYLLLPRSPAVLAFLDSGYLTWHLAHIGLVCWIACRTDSRERHSAWLAYVLTWIGLGVVLASLVPSAGPVYTAGYADLFPRTWVHGHLWDSAARGDVFIGAGVSAFPSLHVAVPVLGACLSWKSSRWLAAAWLGFTAFILWGAVSLGWHWAVDGYASILLVPVIAWLAGRAGRRRPAPGEEMPSGRSATRSAVPEARLPRHRARSAS
jgi:hypothetical protein